MPNTPPTLEPLLDPRAVAALLGVHQNTVLKLARSGSLPAFRLGRHWRFRRCDIDAWLKSKVFESFRSTDYKSALADLSAAAD